MRMIVGKIDYRLLMVFFGAVTALPFVFENLFALCFVGFVPICFVLFSKFSKKRAFCALFCFYFSFYFVLYSFFINLYPLDFAGLSGTSSVLVIICAVVFIPALHTAEMAGLCFLLYMLYAKKKINAMCAVSFSFSVVLGEFVQSLGSLAFPWGRLFVPQTAFLPLVQSASIFGSYFVSFVTVLFASLVALGLTRPKYSFKRKLYVTLGFLIVLVNVCYGAVRLYVVPVEKDTEKITVAALQGNMPSTEKWADGVVEQSKKRYSLLANEAVQKSKNKTVHLLVTPETAFPVTMYADGKETYNSQNVDVFLKDLASKTGANIVAGAFYNEEGKDYNSLFVYCPDKTTYGPNHKQHIVPFGEYLPYRKVFEIFLPWLTEMNVLGSDLSASEENEVFSFEFGKLGTLVCFDSIFSDTCRLQVKDGARIIAVCTNDAWYKKSAALRQHASHSVMRAVENNVPVVRAANTGISMIISPKGEILSQLGANEFGIVLSDEVCITNKETLYTKIGDVILLVGAVFVIIHILWYNFPKRFKNV